MVPPGGVNTVNGVGAAYRGHSMKTEGWYWFNDEPPHGAGEPLRHYVLGSVSLCGAHWLGEKHEGSLLDGEEHNWCSCQKCVKRYREQRRAE